MYDNFEDHGASDLPSEAFVAHMEPLEINDSWIRNAKPSEQLDAMRAWWYRHYENPAQSTPYNGREGGYLYVHGGPFDPAAELEHRFSSLVDQDVIEELVSELHSEVGDQWAPVQRYDDEFDVEPERRHEPLAHLRWALEGDCDQLVALANEQPRAQAVLLRHAFIAMVAAMETYLWETTKYWVTAEPAALQNLVTRSHSLKDLPLRLGDIFRRHAGLAEEITGYLRDIVWHRLDTVKPLLQSAFDMPLPSVKALQHWIVVRHDLVHRNGRTSAGEQVHLTRDHLDRLQRLTLEFCISVEEAVVSKWPDEGSELSLGALRDRLAAMGEAGKVDPPMEPPDDFAAGM